MRFRSTLSLLAVAALAFVTYALGALPQDPGTELHWAQQLARRVMAREAASALVNEVVLVPDAATFVAEIGRWTPQRRWPVLIEDDRYAPIFIRAFQPARVMRRASVGGELPKGEALRRRLVATAWRSWGGEVETPGASDELPLDELITGYEAHLRTLGDPAPGIVLGIPDDSAWTAALALSAGRGLPLRFLPGRFGRPGDTLRAERLQELQGHVSRLLDGTALSWRGLGDAIETICICGDLAIRAQYDPRAAGGAAFHDAGGVTHLATTDMIGRLPDASRGAFAGFIFGPETRSAYVAMCSLFLPRQRVLLFNGYGTDEPWRHYAMTQAQALFDEAGLETTERSGVAANADGWQTLLLGGWSHDIALVNSSGNVDFFNVGAGERRNAGDVPTLARPVAVHFIHSWSFRFPTDLGTVGARFIDQGAYAFIGSVEEPGLSAFLPPSQLAPRMAGAVPFLVAARMWNGPMTRPWRVATYGDPLMAVVAPAHDARKRIPPEITGADLRAEVMEQMRTANDKRSATALAAAIHGARLLGEDEVVVGLFRAGRAGSFMSAAAARSALPSFFARSDADGFIEAWLESEPTDGAARDMAWHLLLGRMRPGDRTIPMILESALREGRPAHDALRLYRRMLELVGRDEARAFLQRALDQMPNETNARLLRNELNR